MKAARETGMLSSIHLFQYVTHLSTRLQVISHLHPFSPYAMIFQPASVIGPVTYVVTAGDLD